MPVGRRPATAPRSAQRSRLGSSSSSVGASRPPVVHVAAIRAGGPAAAFLGRAQRSAVACSVEARAFGAARRREGGGLAPGPVGGVGCRDGVSAESRGHACTSLAQVSGGVVEWGDAQALALGARATISPAPAEEPPGRDGGTGMWLWVELWGKEGDEVLSEGKEAHGAGGNGAVGGASVESGNAPLTLLGRASISLASVLDAYMWQSVDIGDSSGAVATFEREVQLWAPKRLEPAELAQQRHRGEAPVASLQLRVWCTHDSQVDAPWPDVASHALPLQPGKLSVKTTRFDPLPAVRASVPECNAVVCAVSHVTTIASTPFGDRAAQSCSLQISDASTESVEIAVVSADESATLLGHASLPVAATLAEADRFPETLLAAAKAMECGAEATAPTEQPPSRISEQESKSQPAPARVTTPERGSTVKKKHATSLGALFAEGRAAFPKGSSTETPGQRLGNVRRRRSLSQLPEKKAPAPLQKSGRPATAPPAPAPILKLPAAQPSTWRVLTSGALAVPVFSANVDELEHLIGYITVQHTFSAESVPPAAPSCASEAASTPGIVWGTTEDALIPAAADGPVGAAEGPGELHIVVLGMLSDDDPAGLDALDVNLAVRYSASRSSLSAKWFSSMQSMMQAAGTAPSVGAVTVPLRWSNARRKVPVLQISSDSGDWSAHLTLAAFVSAPGQSAMVVLPSARGSRGAAMVLAAQYRSLPSNLGEAEKKLAPSSPLYRVPVCGWNGDLGTLSSGTLHVHVATLARLQSGRLIGQAEPYVTLSWQDGSSTRTSYRTRVSEPLDRPGGPTFSVNEHFLLPWGPSQYGPFRTSMSPPVVRIQVSDRNTLSGVSPIGETELPLLPFLLEQSHLWDVTVPIHNDAAKVGEIRLLCQWNRSDAANAATAAALHPQPALGGPASPVRRRAAGQADSAMGMIHIQSLQCRELMLGSSASTTSALWVEAAVQDSDDVTATVLSETTRMLDADDTSCVKWQRSMAVRFGISESKNRMEIKLFAKSTDRRRMKRGQTQGATVLGSTTLRLDEVAKPENVGRLCVVSGTIVSSNGSSGRISVGLRYLPPFRSTCHLRIRGFAPVQLAGTATGARTPRGLGASTAIGGRPGEAVTPVDTSKWAVRARVGGVGEWVVPTKGTGGGDLQLVLPLPHDGSAAAMTDADAGPLDIVVELQSLADGAARESTIGRVSCIDAFCALGRRVDTVCPMRNQRTVASAIAPVEKQLAAVVQLVPLHAAQSGDTNAVKSAQVTSELKRLFYSIDIDGSGQISPAELRAGLEESSMLRDMMKTQSVGASKSESLFDIMDRDDDDKVTWDEFVGFATTMEKSVASRAATEIADTLAAAAMDSVLPLSNRLQAVVSATESGSSPVDALIRTLSPSSGPLTSQQDDEVVPAPPNGSGAVVPGLRPPGSGEGESKKPSRPGKGPRPSTAPSRPRGRSPAKAKTLSPTKTAVSIKRVRPRGSVRGKSKENVGEPANPNPRQAWGTQPTTQSQSPTRTAQHPGKTAGRLAVGETKPVTAKPARHKGVAKAKGVRRAQVEKDLFGRVPAAKRTMPALRDAEDIARENVELRKVLDEKNGDLKKLRRQLEHERNQSRKRLAAASAANAAAADDWAADLVGKGSRHGSPAEEILALKVRIEDINRVNSESSTRIKAVEQERDKLSSRLEQLTKFDAISNTEGVQSLLRDDLGGTTATLDDYNHVALLLKEVDSDRATHDQILQLKVAVRAGMERVVSMHRAHNRQLKDVQESLKSVEGRLDRKRTKVAKLKKSESSLQDTVCQKDAVIEKLREQLKLATDELQAMRRAQNDTFNKEQWKTQALAAESARQKQILRERERRLTAMQSAAFMLQRILRGAKDRRKFQESREGAVMIQSQVRRRLATKNVHGKRQRHYAAVKIQRRTRGSLARRRVGELHKQRAAATTIQSGSRGHLARKRVSAIKQKRAAENRGAIGVQRVARGHHSRKRARTLLKERLEKQNDAAIKIQRVSRGRRGRQLAMQRAEEKAAAEKAAAEQAAAEKAARSEQEHAATNIQKVHRGHVSRRRTVVVRREKTMAATKIQSTHRGYMVRRARQAQPAITSVDDEQQAMAATKIQSAHRGFMVRKARQPHPVSSVDDEALEAAAVTIQRVARGRQARDRVRKMKADRAKRVDQEEHRNVIQRFLRRNVDALDRDVTAATLAGPEASVRRQVPERLQQMARASPPTSEGWHEDPTATAQARVGTMLNTMLA